MEWQNAPDIKSEIEQITRVLDLEYINVSRVICYRSFGSTSRARARIWSLPRVWQQALEIPPAYVIEVISEKFDGLSGDDRKRILIHEIMHIPKNFSGSLLPHRGRGKGINYKTVEKLFQEYQKNSNGYNFTR